MLKTLIGEGKDTLMFLRHESFFSFPFHLPSFLLVQSRKRWVLTSIVFTEGWSSQEELSGVWLSLISRSQHRWNCSSPAHPIQQSGVIDCGELLGQEEIVLYWGCGHWYISQVPVGGTTHIHLLDYQTKKIKSHEVGRGHVESDLEEFQGDVGVRYDHIFFLERKEKRKNANWVWTYNRVNKQLPSLVSTSSSFLSSYLDLPQWWTLTCNVK